MSRISNSVLYGSECALSMLLKEMDLRGTGPDLISA